LEVSQGEVGGRKLLVKIAKIKVNARINVRAGRLDNIQLGSAKNFV